MAEKKEFKRPLKFPKPEDLQKAVDLYFESLVIYDSNGNKEGEKPPTVSGLAYALDVETETLRNYEKRDKYFAIIKRAKQRVEMALEERLFGNAPTGSIFNLKCNFGYRDNVDQSSSDDAKPIKPVFNVSEAKSDVKVTRGAK